MPIIRYAESAPGMSHLAGYGQSIGFDKFMAKIPQQLPLRRTQRQALHRKHVQWITLGALLLLAVAIWLVHLALEPTKRKTVVMSAGGQEGIYMSFAKRYAAALAREGIPLDVRSSSGAVENYQRLKDESSEFDIGLVQSGTGNAKDAPNLQTLASVSYEPIWIFYRDRQTIDRLSQLVGKQVGVGQPGSGLRTVMLSLLALHDVTTATAGLKELSAAGASRALMDGTLDAAAFIGAPDIPLIQTLLRSDLKLISLSQADTVVRRFPSLAKVIFPRGAVSLARDLPPQDVTLLATTALLVAKKSLHTEVAYQLLDAANEVHGLPSFFADRGDFPNQRIEDFPITEETKRYFRSGRPYLQNYLPFWLASFIEQRFVILVPATAVFFALLQTLPRLYAYRIRSRLARWYHEIKLLEDEVQATTLPDLHRRLHWLRELDEIDANVGSIRVPEAFIRDTYVLKHAIRMVRQRIESRMPLTPPQRSARV